MNCGPCTGRMCIRDRGHRGRLLRGGPGSGRARGRAVRGALGGVLVHGDPVVGRQSHQAVGVALPQRAELPPVGPPVQLTADQGGLGAGLGPYVEVGHRFGGAGRGGVVQQDPQIAHLLERHVLRGGDDQDPVHHGRHRPQVRLHGVGDRLADLLLAEPPHRPRGVPGLVVEDEVLVRAHPAVRAHQQRRGVDVGNLGAAGPAQHRPDRHRGHRDVRALLHRVRHARHPALWGRRGTTRPPAGPCPGPKTWARCKRVT